MSTSGEEPERITHPVVFTGDARREKVLDLNGCTLNLMLADSLGDTPLISNGYIDGTGRVQVDLVIDDFSEDAKSDPAKAGALICNNAKYVVSIEGNGSRDSSLTLSKGTISGGKDGAVNASMTNPGSDGPRVQFTMVDGTISDSQGPGVNIGDGTNFAMNGGTITGNVREGVKANRGSSFTMTDGTISYNGLEPDDAQTDGQDQEPRIHPGVNLAENVVLDMANGKIINNGAAGVLLNYNSKLNMTNGEISSNTENGVMVFSGSSTMSAGTIQNNKQGCGVVLAGSENKCAIFSMSGGKITGNATGVNVGAETNYNAFILFGKPAITGNATKDGDSNVVLNGQQKIYITGTLGNPEGESASPQIGVTTKRDSPQYPDVFTSGYCPEHNHFNELDPSTFFTSDVKTIDGKTAYVCWVDGDDGSHTGANGEGAILTHTHDWMPAYQFKLGEDGEWPLKVYDPSVLTAVCEKNIHNLEHGACEYPYMATLTISAQSKLYDGEPVTATVTPNDIWTKTNPLDLTTGIYAYYDEDGVKLEGAPKDQGKYFARFWFDEGVLPTAVQPDGVGAEQSAGEQYIEAKFTIIKRDDISYAAHAQTYGWKAPSGSNGTTAGTTGEGKRLEAVKIELGDDVDGSIEYRSHVQGKGWESSWAKDGALAGTTGQAKRLEAVRVRLTGDMRRDFSVWYRVHSQTYGWLGWAKDGADAGTTGLSKRVEAIDVQVLPKGQRPVGYDAGRAACVAR